MYDTRYRESFQICLKAMFPVFLLFHSNTECYALRVNYLIAVSAVLTLAWERGAPETLPDPK